MGQIIEVLRHFATSASGSMQARWSGWAFIGGNGGPALPATTDATESQGIALDNKTGELFQMQRKDQMISVLGLLPPGKA